MNNKQNYIDAIEFLLEFEEDARSMMHLSSIRDYVKNLEKEVERLENELDLLEQSMYSGAGRRRKQAWDDDA